MKNILLLIGLSIMFFSCEKEKPCEPSSSLIESLNYVITNTTNLAEDEAALNDLLEKIRTLSESKTCSEAVNWTFTAYGAKACGGPIGYMAYSKCINTADFLNKVAVFTELQSQYNNKYAVVSTCDVPPPPKSVECEIDKPVLVY